MPPLHRIDVIPDDDYDYDDATWLSDHRHHHGRCLLFIYRWYIIVGSCNRLDILRRGGRAFWTWIETLLACMVSLTSMPLSWLAYHLKGSNLQEPSHIVQHNIRNIPSMQLFFFFSVPSYMNSFNAWKRWKSFFFNLSVQCAWLGACSYRQPWCLIRFLFEWCDTKKPWGMLVEYFF